MTDFSAAAIARLVPHGLKRLGISMPIPPAPQAAHMSIDAKRRMLDAIVLAHGEQTLASLGAGVLDATDEPLLSAFSPTRGPHDLVARWQRLERYIHSSHRVRIEGAGEHRLLLRHVSMAREPAPHRHEDMLIFGLLVGLLALSGTQQLKARLHGEHEWRYLNRRWQPVPWPVNVSHWEVQWTGCSTQFGPVAPHADQAPAHGIDPTDCVAMARQLMSQDPARSWSISALACDMNMTARSLQRKLALQHSSFTALLAHTRVNSAAQLLTTTGQAPAQIGYDCGYSDQPHFIREFKRHTAFTPLQYRAAFATGLV